MDLGSGICTSRNPRCLLCPLAEPCIARASGNPERFPVKAAKKPRPERHGMAFWIERDGAVWLVRRPGKGMLGGMIALPDDGWNARADGGGQPPFAGQWETAGRVEHVFTHFSLTLSLSVHKGVACAGLDPEHGGWWPLERLDEAGMPTLFAKAARLALARDES